MDNECCPAESLLGHLIEDTGKALEKAEVAGSEAKYLSHRHGRAQSMDPQRPILKSRLPGIVVTVSPELPSE